MKDSKVLDENEKAKILARWPNKINKESELIVSSDKKRSQLKNREIAFKKMDRILNKAFETVKKRKKTKPGKSAIEKRLKQKKIQSEKKELRKRIK